MDNSHTTPTHPTPFRFGLHVLRRARHGARRPGTERREAALAKELQAVVFELLGPLALDDQILACLDYGHAASTTQLARLLRRRKTTMVHAVRALVAAGKLERCGRRWKRVKENTR